MSVTAEILLIRTNITRTNVAWKDIAWTNVTVTVEICPRCSQEPIFKVSSKSGQLELRYSWYGDMLWGQMLPGQMSQWQFESVLDVHRNPPLKFHQNRISNSWDIADIEFVWGGWMGGVCKVILSSNPTVVLCWVGALTTCWQFWIISGL